MRVERVYLEQVGPFETLDLVFPPGRDPTRADVHLLVGENGTGKSTVLAAIAQVFGLGDAGFLRRCWDDGAPKALVHLEGSMHPLGVGRSGAADLLGFRIIHTVAGVGYTALDYPNLANADLFQLRAARIDDALFAYGGLRAASDDAVTGVQEQRENPLKDANLFVRSRGTQALVQWVANTYAMSAIHAKKGEDDRARDRTGALRTLEDALASATGEARVSFVVDVDPFAVRLAVGPRPAVPIGSLPDGVQSLLSWVGDLLMRLDRIPWATPRPATERAFVLLLDEVEVHLHPRWQRAALPMAERLFPNAQIIASTHSPFVIGSASDAWIHRFRDHAGRVLVDPPVPGPQGHSTGDIVRDLMGLPTAFDEESEQHIGRLKAAISTRLSGDARADVEVAAEVRWLADRSAELAVIAQHELRQLQRQLSSSAAK